tara:strand:+ start:572 stop:889 length:318 start_codon:yes stop_codon:yes gene_type:complete
MKDINYKTEDTSISVNLKYSVAHRMKFYHKGKCWPKHTQCLITINGVIEGFGTVIKHDIDKDNQSFAYKMATKKALEHFNYREGRKEIWKMVHKQLETLEDEHKH